MNSIRAIFRQVIAGLAAFNAAASVLSAASAPARIGLASPANHTTFVAPAEIVLKAAMPDTGSPVEKIEYFNGLTKLGESTRAPHELKWAPVAAGAYSLTVAATDHVGVTTTSAPVAILVNAPPTVALVAPANQSTFTAPAAVLLKATTSDSDGTIARVEFFRNGIKVGQATHAPFQFEATQVGAGAHIMTARATDNLGAVATSAPVQIIVNAPPRIALASPVPSMKFTAPAVIPLVATAADADGTIAKVEFFNGARKIGEAVAPPFQMNWAEVQAGSYTLSARATDSSGATATSAAVTVRVNSAPQVSLSMPGVAGVLIAPASIALQAAATDADGTINKVEFYRGSSKLGEATTAPYRFTWTNAAAGSHSLTARATDNSGTSTTSSPVLVIVDAPPKIVLATPQASGPLTAPAAVILKATATDADGSIAKVEFFEGAAKLGQVTTVPYIYTVAALAAGSHTFTAIATDNLGIATTSTPVAVVVNAPPTVTLTAPSAGTIVAAPATIALQASAGDSDGTVAKVEFYRGLTKLGEATAAPFSFKWANAPAGTYVLSAKATDNAGAVAVSPPVSLIVNALPKIALTTAAGVTKFTTPATIALVAAASDSDGTIAKVEFFNGATKVGEAGSAPYRLTLTGLAAGTYALTARATDNRGGVSTSAPWTFVVNAPPTVALTAPSSGAILSAPASVVLQAAAGDSDGTVVKVEFFRGSTKIGETANAPYHLTWSQSSAGTFALTARATDNLGDTTTTLPVSVVVNAPPRVVLTAPASGGKFTAPASVVLKATATDSDGTVAKVEFYNGASKLGEAASPPYQWSWTSVAAGTYSITARAIDNLGASVASSPVTILVDAPPVVALTMPATGTVVTAPASVTLAATAGDPDGTVSKVEFFDGATRLGQVTAAPFQWLWPGPPLGAHALSAKATDNQGAVAVSPPVALIVNGPPAVKITTPANNAAFSAPASISLLASATDADGTIAKVEFFSGATKVGEAHVPPFQTVWWGVAAGNYTVTARATDNLGAVAMSPSVAVKVTPPTGLPVVMVTSPPAEAVVDANAPVTLVASVSGISPGPAKVEFFNGGTRLGEAIAASGQPGSFTLTLGAGFPPGNVSLVARATDAAGVVTNSAASALIVNASPALALTSPTAGSVFGAPATLTLAAAATDSDGSVAKVEFFNGTAKLGEATAAPYQLVASGLPAGSYVLTARATDNRGAVKNSAGMPIRVDAPPVVSLMSPVDGTVFVTPASIALNAVATDPDGAVARVEFFRGATKLGEATAAPYSFTWGAVSPGNYSVTAVATDDLGVTTTSAPISLLVDAPPVVALTSPTSNTVLKGPAAITLSASATDSDGTVVRVEFFNGAVKIGEATAAPFQSVWPDVAPGSYALTAKATDDLGATAVSAPVAVQVTAPNVPPVVEWVSPTEGLVVAAPADLSLQAAATDADDAVAKVEFFTGTTKLGEVISPPYKLSVTALPAGSYAFTAKATDAAGATATSSILHVVVNALPTVAITEPTGGTVLNEPANVTIVASASDRDGTVAKVEFFGDGEKIGEATAAPFQFVWLERLAGNYVLTARATDEVGGSTVSAPVSFRVASAGNLPPLVTLFAPSDGALVSGGKDLTLEATAVDNDGAITRVEFYSGATKLGESSTAPYQYIWPSVPAGSYQLIARAYDNSGEFSDSIPVAINATSSLAVLLSSPAEDSGVTAPASIDLAAEVILQGGIVAKVEFYNDETLIGETTAAPYRFTWANVGPGVFPLKARAYDTTGGIVDSETLTITVTAPRLPPTVTLSGPADGATVVIPSPINLTAVAAAPGGTVARVEFSANGALLGRVLAPPYSYSWNLIPPGAYSLVATVFDSAGASSTSSAINIVVVAPHSPPVVALTDPVQGSRFRTTDTIPLAAEASASGGTIAKVEFYQGDTKLGESIADPFVLPWSGMPAGTYEIRARAYDGTGASATTAPVNIQVGVPPVVMLTAPVADSTVTVPVTVSLAATATTTAGKIARVEFYQGGTLLGSASAAPYQIGWSGAVPGDYALVARAFGDNGTYTDSAPVAIHVGGRYPPTVALTFPEPGLTFAVGSTISLLATAQEVGGAIARLDFLRDASFLGSRTLTGFEDPAVPQGIGARLGVSGTFSFSVRAIDAAGIAVDSAPVALTVTAAKPPVVSLSASRTGANSASLTATASAPAGSLTKVEFYAGAAQLASIAGPPFVFPWSNVAPGTYALRARAYDNVGGVSVSTPVSFTSLSALPFVANFETPDGYSAGSLAGQRGWSVARVAAEISSGDVFAGARSVVIQPAQNQPTVEQQVQANPAQPVVFVDFFAQPVADPAPTFATIFSSAGTQIAVQEVGHHGEVLVYSSQSNGDTAIGWLSTGRVLPLNGDHQVINWVRFTQRIDYGVHSWDLYLDGRMVMANIAMDPGFTKPAAFTIRGHASRLTRLDDVYVGYDNPLFQDTARDGIDDAWKIAHGLDPAVDARNLDPANSGLPVIEKYIRGLDPKKFSTAGDGISDGWKIANGLDPLAPSPAHFDPFGEGLTFLQKYSLRTILASGTPFAALQDSDGDGWPDIVELSNGTDPLDYFNGTVPVVTPLADYSNQFGPNGAIAARITDAQGNLLVNAPITFTTTPGNLLTANPYGRGRAVTLTVRSNAEGIAIAYVRPAF